MLTSGAVAANWQNTGFFSDNARVLVSVQFLNWGELQPITKHSHTGINNWTRWALLKLHFFQENNQQQQKHKTIIDQKEKRFGTIETESAPIGKRLNLWFLFIAVFVSILYSLSTWNQFGLHQFCWKRKKMNYSWNHQQALWRGRSFNYITISKTYGSHLSL